MKEIKDKNIRIRSATKKDLPKLVKFSLLCENEKVVLSNKGHFWQKHLDKKLIEQLIKKGLQNKNNYLLIAEDSTRNCIGFLRAVLVNMDPIMKVRTICGLKELVVLPRSDEKKVLIKLVNTLIKKIQTKTKYFTIHVDSNNKKVMADYIEIGFRPSYLCLGKQVKAINEIKNQDIKVRSATQMDLSELVKLHILFELEERKITGTGDFWRSYLNKALVKKDIQGLFKDKNNYYFVAENFQGKIIGFLNALLEEMPQTIKTNCVCGMKILYVLAEYRGKTISSMLMTTMEKIIIKKTKYFVIYVYPNNKKAMAIYLKNGFNPLYLCLGKQIKKRI